MFVVVLSVTKFWHLWPENVGSSQRIDESRERRFGVIVIHFFEVSSDIDAGLSPSHRVHRQDTRGRDR